jgi:hypothetical protein
VPQRMHTRHRKFKSEEFWPEAYEEAQANWFGIPAGTKRVLVNPGKRVVFGSQTTDSEGHPKNRKTGSYEEGGPFYTCRTNADVTYARINLFRPSTGGPEWAQRYSGPIFVEPPDKPLTDYLSWTRSKDLSDLDPWGAKAVALCSPTNPIANLGSGLAQLVREGIPSLIGINSWKHRTEAARAAGSEFLNFEFGWLPLVKEVEDVVNAVRFHRDLIEQYKRDEGNKVRRDWYFPSDNTVNETLYKQQCRIGNASISGLNDHQGYVHKEEITSSRKWFSGCFTYGLPSSNDYWRRVLGFGSNADHLFGTSLTPDVLWELAPWSWAIDWFVDAGDVIHNLTSMSLYGLIMRYGYIMETKTITTTYRQVDTGFSSKFVKLQPGSPPIPTLRIEQCSKVRGVANPFGFGLLWDDLSPTQLAIAAACGITRL